MKKHTSSKGIIFMQETQSLKLKRVKIHGQTSLDVEITILYFLTVYKIAEEFLLPSNMYMMVVDLLYLALSLKTALWWVL